MITRVVLLCPTVFLCSCAGIGDIWMPSPIGGGGGPGPFGVYFTPAIEYDNESDNLWPWHSEGYHYSESPFELYYMTNRSCIAGLNLWSFVKTGGRKVRATGKNLYGTVTGMPIKDVRQGGLTHGTHGLCSEAPGPNLG